MSSTQIIEQKVVSTKDLHFDIANPNRMSAVKYQSLKYSIQKYGYVSPLTIDQDNTVINGNNRLKALLELGIDTISVIQIEFESEAARKKFRAAMNKIHGEHDPELDRNDILAIIRNSEEDKLDYMRLTGQNDERVLFKILNRNRGSQEEESKHTCPNCGHTYFL